MRDWRRLRPSSPHWLYVVQVVTFIGSLGVGGYLGWRLFLAEPDDASPGSQSSVRGANAPTETASTELAVQTTGIPAVGLGGLVRVGQTAPDFSLEDLNGQRHSLQQHAGQVVLLNFWATWCPPCREEMPALQEAANRYGQERFVILGVNLTETEDGIDSVRAFRDELKLSFPILLDGDSKVSEDLYHILGLPTSILVARDGTVRDVVIGPLSVADLERRLQSLLSEGSLDGEMSVS